MDKASSIALIGAGSIGRRHAEVIMACSDVALLDAIVDPARTTQGIAAEYGVPWFPDIAAMLTAGTPDGVIIASPNQLHATQALECIAKNIPVLVEKPIASDVAAARRMVDASEEKGVPLLVGHHRRHNPLIEKAKMMIESGAIGKIVAVHAMFWVYKPDDYFEVEWRRRRGSGPVFINLIHDVDLLRYLCGEIVSVQAMQSSAARNLANEDTAVVILRFASGSLGTINMSDTVVAPWSWELTSKENPAYPPTDEFCYLIGGTEGSLEIPDLRKWSYSRKKKSWLERLESDLIDFSAAEPLERQIRHFCAVIRGEDQPLVPGREGLRTLEVIEAIKQSADTGRAIKLTSNFPE
jgi:predicted dehydrogenase